MYQIHPLQCGWGMAFLIECETGLFLVDSGSPGKHQVILDKMQQLGYQELRLIWITHAHYDHYGNALALKEKTGSLIGVHSSDARDLQSGRSRLGSPRLYGFIYFFAQWFLQKTNPLPPTLPDFTREHLQTLAEFGLDAIVYHTPGHTPGHTCLKLSDGTVFAGDLLGAFPKPGLQRLLATNWSQLPASLETLKAAKPIKIFCGHSPHPLSGEDLSTIHSSPARSRRE